METKEIPLITINNLLLSWGYEPIESVNATTLRVSEGGFAFIDDYGRIYDDGSWEDIYDERFTLIHDFFL